MAKCLCLSCASAPVDVVISPQRRREYVRSFITTLYVQVLRRSIAPACFNRRRVSFVARHIKIEINYFASTAIYSLDRPVRSAEAPRSLLENTRHPYVRPSRTGAERVLVLSSDPQCETMWHHLMAGTGS